MRIAGAGNNRVWLDKPAKLGVIVPGTIVVQPGIVIEDLAGKAVADTERLGIVGKPFFAKRSVLIVLDKVALSVGQIVKERSASSLHLSAIEIRIGADASEPWKALLVRNASEADFAHVEASYSAHTWYVPALPSCSAE